MTCDRCAELLEEIVYLRSELGLSSGATELGLVREALRDVGAGGARIAAAAGLICALYGAKGRVLLLELVPPTRIDNDRDVGIVKVWVCYARKGLGESAIENVWGRGYRLTLAGLERVRAILEPARVAA